MGETFRASKNYELAMEYLQQSLGYFKKHPDPVMLARIHNRIAATLLEMWYIAEGSLFGNLITSNPELSYLAKLELSPDLKIKDDSLLSSIQESKLQALQSNRFDLITSTNIIEGSYLVTTKQYEKAVILFEETEQIIEREKVYEDLPLIYLNWSRLYSIGYLDKPEQAIELAKKALEIAQAQDIPVYEFMANNTIQGNYAYLGDFENAYTYLLKQVPLIQEYGEKDLLTQLKTLKFQYEFQESERELQVKQEQLRLILMSIGIVVLFTSIFIYSLSRNNNKQRELLSALSKKNQIISQQNQELEQTNAEKDRFFAILAHDLKGPIKAVATSLNLINENLKNGQVENTIIMTSAVTTAAQRASDLLMNLVEWAKSQQGKLHVKLQKVNLAAIIQENLNLFEENLILKELKVHNDLPESLELISDKDILNTVIRNVLSNAIKFSNKSGAIQIHVEKEEEEVTLSIMDEGIGMDEEMVRTIFKIDSYNSRPGTAGEVSSGLGLILCKDFLSHVNGEIHLISEENKGTKVSITLPFHT